MIGRRAFLTVAVLGLLAAPSRSPAQDAGVSGIPPGPANARGLNGSVNDPSGIGNAARVPAIAPPKISPSRLILVRHLPRAAGAAGGKDQTNAICDIQIASGGGPDGPRGRR
jgi:hypothetical protein